jgi:hypothetical protein
MRDVAHRGDVRDPAVEELVDVAVELHHRVDALRPTVRTPELRPFLRGSKLTRTEVGGPHRGSAVAPVGAGGGPDAHLA